MQDTWLQGSTVLEVRNSPNQQKFSVDSSGNASAGALLSVWQLGVNSKFTVDQNGRLMLYNNAAAAGNGMAPFIYSTVQAGQTAAITNTTMVIPGTNAPYRFTGQISCTAASSGATATLNLNWTDTANTTQTYTATATCTTLGPASIADMTSTVAVTWSVTISGSLSYAVDARFAIDVIREDLLIGQHHRGV